MLTEFSIGNYQAFSTPQRVPLKPITLIFGPNSAGKSSLLRSLLVAKHAILNGRLSKSEGAGERHPGSYADMVRNGSSNPITFEFSVQSAGEPIEIGLSWREKNEAGLETVALTLKKKESEVVGYSTKGSSKHLQISSMGHVITQLMLAARSDSDADEQSHDVIQSPIKRRLALQTHVAVPGSDADHYRVVDTDADEFDLLQIMEDMDAKGKSTETSSALMSKMKVALNSIKLEVSTPIKAAEASLRDTLKKFIYHGPIRPICDEVTKDRLTEPGMTEWWNLAAEPKLLAKVNDWLAGDIFKTKYRLDFDRLFPDSSLRQLLQSLSEERSISELVETAFEAKLDSDDAFFEREIDSVAPDLEDDSLDEHDRVEIARQQARDLIYNDAWDRGIDHYNSLLEDSDVDEIESFLLGGLNRTLANLRGMLESVRQGRGSKTPGGFDSAKVRFSSTTSSQPVSPSNMGIGFSQMMPLVASAFGSEDSLIAIEQPELHVHPALQTELGDIFIQSAMERGNRFLIETHSEHLILRIMRCMRETFEGHRREGLPPVTPNDVCILYVEPGESGSIVREMPLNERGELIKGWPGGFFEEALNEMF
jgi:predicted ATPase